MSYYLGIYRHHAAFPDDVVVRALSIIARRLPGFFPAELPVARKRSIRLLSPSDFDRSMVPAVFTIEPGVCVRIPIDGADGSELTILDDRAPDVQPANVVLRFPAAPTLPDAAEGVLRDLIVEFQPDEALFTDEKTPLEKDVRERWIRLDTSKVPAMFYWLTWLNPGLIEVAGPEALERLSAVSNVRPLGGGALVRLQDEPPVPGEAWSRRRQAAEDALGLAGLHRRFPRVVD